MPHKAPTEAAIEINEFLLSGDAGVEVKGHSVESLKKAIKKHFSKVEGLEVLKKGDKIYLLNKRLI